MDPLIWGPECWTILHALAWRTDNKLVPEQLTIRIFEMLPDVLPCSLCQENVRSKLDIQQPLFDWTVQLHNSVKNTSYNLNVAKHREALREMKPFSEEVFIRLFVYIASTFPRRLSEWAFLWNAVFQSWPVYDLRLPETNDVDVVVRYFSVPILRKRILDIIKNE